MDISLKGKIARHLRQFPGHRTGGGERTGTEWCQLYLDGQEPSRPCRRRLISWRNRETRQHQWMAVDFSDTKMVEEAIKTIAGKQTIEILVNNSGGPKAGANSRSIY